MSPARVFVLKSFWKEPEEGEGNPACVPGFHQMLLTFSFLFLGKKPDKSHLMPGAALVFSSNSFSVPSLPERKTFQFPFLHERLCSRPWSTACSVFLASGSGSSAIEGPQ